jgi:hypothetical protein
VPIPAGHFQVLLDALPAIHKQRRQPRSFIDLLKMTPFTNLQGAILGTFLFQFPSD